jgi:hypothetical protein
MISEVATADRAYLSVCASVLSVSQSTAVDAGWWVFVASAPLLVLNPSELFGGLHVPDFVNVLAWDVELG